MIIGEGGEASSFEADVTPSSNGRQAMVRARVDRFGRLDILHKQRRHRAGDAVGRSTSTRRSGTGSSTRTSSRCSSPAGTRYR